MYKNRGIKFSNWKWKKKPTCTEAYGREIPPRLHSSRMSDSTKTEKEVISSTWLLHVFSEIGNFKISSYTHHMCVDTLFCDVWKAGHFTWWISGVRNRDTDGK